MEKEWLITEAGGNRGCLETNSRRHRVSAYLVSRKRQSTDAAKSQPWKYTTWITDVKHMYTSPSCGDFATVDLVDQTHR